MKAAPFITQKEHRGGWKELTEFYHAPCGRFISSMKDHECVKPTGTIGSKDNTQKIGLSFKQAVGRIADVLMLPGRDWKNATVAEMARDIALRLGWRA